ADTVAFGARRRLELGLLLEPGIELELGFEHLDVLGQEQLEVVEDAGLHRRRSRRLRAPRHEVQGERERRERTRGGEAPVARERPRARRELLERSRPRLGEPRTRGAVEIADAVVEQRFRAALELRVVVTRRAAALI